MVEWLTLIVLVEVVKMKASYVVRRDLSGKVLFLRYGYWVLEKSMAQAFQSADAARGARNCKRQGGEVVLLGTFGTKRITDSSPLEVV